MEGGHGEGDGRQGGGQGEGQGQLRSKPAMAITASIRGNGVEIPYINYN